MWKVVSDASSPDYRVGVVYQTRFHWCAMLVSWWIVLRFRPVTLYVTNFSVPELAEWLEMVNNDTSSIYQNGAALQKEQRRHFWILGCLIILVTLDFVIGRRTGQWIALILFCLMAAGVFDISRRIKGVIRD